MNLSTPVEFPGFEEKINYESECLFLGSCFAENIGTWLKNLKFKVVQNPFGITFNPLSLAWGIENVIERSKLSEEDLIAVNGRFVHPQCHSVLSENDSSELLLALESASKEYRLSLSRCNFLFITFGTSIGHRFLRTNEIVNNCHKMPASEFRKENIPIDEMLRRLKVAIEKVQALNPDVNIIFTVSPIRHLRHGAIENNRSKARLILVCEELAKSQKKCTYLPIYEYVMDELRDYRFYNPFDLIHLNEGGLKMVQEKFSEVLLDSSTIPIRRKVEKWNQLMAHIVMHPDSTEANEFEIKKKAETELLEKLLPGRFA